MNAKEKGWEGSGPLMLWRVQVQIPAPSPRGYVSLRTGWWPQGYMGFCLYHHGCAILPSVELTLGDGVLKHYFSHRFIYLFKEL